MNPAARDPNPIEQSKTQIDNYLVRPEFFEVQSWDTAQSVGMTMLQDGDSEGCMGFDPENPRQSKLALKMAGIKAKRQISAATFTRLKSIGFSPRKHTQEGTSSL